MKKVSICIPTYNNPSGIKRLLNSILIQTFSDYEIIITDDSTTDEVEQIVKSYTNKAEIVYQRNKTRDGSTANWNKALDLAQGEYIKIMHHDDWFSDERSLGEFVRLLDENPQAILAFSGTWQVSSKEKYSRCISDNDLRVISRTWKNLYLGNVMGAPSAVIHRRTDARYDENLVWLVDSDFYMNLLSSGMGFACSKEPLISIGVSDEQLTEGCIADKKLNWFEYRYEYIKYDLYTEEKYCKRLREMLLHYDAPLKMIWGMSAGTAEYTKMKIRKTLKKIKDKMTSYAV